MNSEDIVRCMKQLAFFVLLFISFSIKAQTISIGRSSTQNNSPVATFVNGDTTKYAVLYAFASGGIDERTQLFVDGMAVCGLSLQKVTIAKLYKEGITQLSVQEGPSWKSFLHNVNAVNKHKIIRETLNVEFGKQYG